MSAMFSHAALAAASRKAALGPQGAIDLEVGGPNRPEPLIVGGELEGILSPPDLSVSSGTLLRDVLPPAPCPSPEQEGFRRDFLEVVRPTFGANAASGTARNYEAILRGIAPQGHHEIGVRGLANAFRGAIFIRFSGGCSCSAPRPPHPSRHSRA